MKCGPAHLDRAGVENPSPDLPGLTSRMNHHWVQGKRSDRGDVPKRRLGTSASQRLDAVNPSQASPANTTHAIQLAHTGTENVPTLMGQANGQGDKEKPAVKAPTQAVTPLQRAGWPP